MNKERREVRIKMSERMDKLKKIMEKMVNNGSITDS